MSRTSTSIVTDGLLHWVGHLDKIKVPPDADSILKSEWHQWLIDNRKFRFSHGSDVSFTAYKVKNECWKAQRRINGRLRNKYLGVTGELHYARLLDIGHQLALPDELYWTNETGQTTGSQELRELNYKIRGANELIEQYLAAHDKDIIPGSPRWEHLRRFRQWIQLLDVDKSGGSE